MRNPQLFVRRRYSWSDRTGRIAVSKDTVKLPSLHWTWTTDWLIDYTTPGGVDNQGWQYATDFPASYHGKPKFTDYVRRRRWARKCKLTTSGPWKTLGATKLIDISLQVGAAPIPLAQDDSRATSISFLFRVAPDLTS